MGTEVQKLSIRYRAAEILQQYLIPLGWVTILTSMFIAGDRGRVHQLFYIFLALPTFTMLVLRPDLLKALTRNALFICFVMFSSYMIITVAWSSTDDTALSLLRRPLYLALLLFASGIIGLQSRERLSQLTRFSAIVAALAAAISLAYYLKIRQPYMRLEGYGALYNPLLSAHVFGAFATFWLATLLQGRKLFNPLALICLGVLMATLLATGSRTPLVGIGAALAWLLVTGDRKRGLIITSIIALALLAILAADPHLVTQRGFSYRPQIWAESLRQIAEHPWLGYGYDADMKVVIPGASMVLADPHNMELGVLYAGGIIGLSLWVALYAAALRFCWQNRREKAINLAAAWLVFGLGSGLTEGMAFMSRPKEHWFLIWIPLALIYGYWIAHKAITNRRSALN